MQVSVLYFNQDKGREINTMTIFRLLVLIIMAIILVGDFAVAIKKDRLGIMALTGFKIIAFAYIIKWFI